MTKILATLALGALALFMGVVHHFIPTSVGTDTVLPIAGQTYTLAGAGISSTATSFTLTSFTIPQNGYKIQDSEMSDTFYITLEPGSRTRQEIISCTTVVQNANGTASISGCTRGLSPITPYTASTSLQFAHSGGSSVIFSDAPQLFNSAAFKDNDETITGNWIFPTPVVGTNAATRDYVLSVVTGGTVSFDRTIVPGVAGETVASGTIVYYKGTDQRWWKVNASATSTFQDKFIGISQGPANAGSNIPTGVLIHGLDSTGKSLTPGAIYYASSTVSGGTSTSQTAQPLGIARSATTLYFDPYVIGRVNGSTTNTFSATTTFTGSVIGAASPGSTTIITTTGSTTWSKSASSKWIVIEVQGAGGGGGSVIGTDASAGAGGSAGGYAKKTVLASTIPSTVNIFVGAGGSSNTDGQLSAFGGVATGTGGGGPGSSVSGTGGNAGTPGIGVGGDINIAGGYGDPGYADSTTAAMSGSGGDSVLGRGGGGKWTGVTFADGNAAPAGYGAGGGGAATSQAASAAGGAGSQGVVIITEY